MKKSQFLLSTIVAGLTLLATLQTSHAQIVPMRASGSGAEFSPCTGLTTGTGRATHMGRVTVSGLVIPMPTKNPLVFDFTAVNYDLTAANGDQMFFSGSGTVEFMPVGDGSGLFTAFWTSEFHVDGGTGRFKNVGPGDAPLLATAINDPLAASV